MYGEFFRFLPILVRAEGFRVREVEVPEHEEDHGTRIYGPRQWPIGRFCFLAFSLSF